MKSTYSVLAILQSICENKTTRPEINHLIEQSYKIAMTYLKYRYKNLSRVFLAEDSTLQEMAIDAIASLFERNESGEFIRIIKAFKDWDPPIGNEETAQFFLNRLVSKSTEKYVSELLRQSDPFFSKILDSITYLIEKNCYQKKRILGTTFILEGIGEDAMRSNGIGNMGIRNLPDSSFINELPISVFKSNKNVVSEIFDYIKINSNKAPAIPLNALVMKIKSVKAGEFELADSYSNENESEIESITKKAMDICYEKMQKSYIEKGKVSEIEAERIKEALNKIVFDMRDGGINQGLHKYFLEQFPELNFRDYEIKYQNLFEYLFKILKKEIAEQLK
ncbi:MAG TPA: hypothetical protein PKD67_12180 [Ignavibacteriaceae bacterium]|nr:hypothetical protein [Ignavibacteriaceae bacterium]